MAIQDQIAEAGRIKSTIAFNYAKDDGSNSRREVEPYSYKNEDLLCGRDIDKDGIRYFKLAMMSNVEVTGNSFEPRWPIEV